MSTMLHRCTMISRYCHHFMSWNHRTLRMREHVHLRFASDLSQSTQALVDILLDDSESIFKRRMALAKAITLAESSHPQHMRQADLLMYSIGSHRKNGQDDPNGINTDKINKKRRSFRIGITGSPGVGKSSFIDALGTFLFSNKVELEQVDRKEVFSPSSVAVICVDPTSTVSGGSILGDKARMPYLSNCDKAFIRPSPSKGSLGGLSTYTNDAISLCEAAGYELIIVESVGVGQSEIEISHCVDMFILLISPAGGDSLQGMKKGIVEICDLILVTKADGDLLKLAMSTASEYSGALHIARANYGGRSPSVLVASSKSADGLADFWKHVCDFRSMLLESGDLDRIREKHAIYWMWRHLKDLIETGTKSDKNLQKQAQLIEKQLYSETLPPRAAARILYDHIVAQGARKDV